MTPVFQRFLAALAVALVLGAPGAAAGSSDAESEPDLRAFYDPDADVLTLAWERVPGVVGHVVSQGGEVLARLPGTETAFSIASPGTVSWFWVEGVHPADRGWSSGLLVVVASHQETPEPPLPPGFKGPPSPIEYDMVLLGPPEGCSWLYVPYNLLPPSAGMPQVEPACLPPLPPLPGPPVPKFIRGPSGPVDMVTFLDD